MPELSSEILHLGLKLGLVPKGLLGHLLGGSTSGLGVGRVESGVFETERGWHGRVGWHGVGVLTG